MSLVQAGHMPLLRKEEIETVRDWFKPSMRILEIGGGNGYQASVIASWKCDINSIDLPESGPSKERFFPVQHYDGEHIPFPDESFDLVFSSNVLEHIEPLHSMLLEIRRVLMPGGLAVHILPTPSWRAWSSAAHYVAILRAIVRRLQRRAGRTHEPSFPQAGQTAPVGFLMRRNLFPGPHGVYPSALSELYYFSKPRWMRLLQNNGFELVHKATNGLFYTGYGLCPGLSVGSRRRLALVLGSSCHVFILKKTVPQR